jgi:hypothetical protein
MMGVAAGVYITGDGSRAVHNPEPATILPLNSVTRRDGSGDGIEPFVLPVHPMGKHFAMGTAVAGSAMSIMSNIGRATMMAAFGSSYGYIVMSRLSYLVARLQFLLGTWLRRVIATEYPGPRRL